MIISVFSQPFTLNRLPFTDKNMPLITEKNTINTFNKIENLWKTALSDGLPIALWRLPKTSEKQLIIDLSGHTSKVKVDLEELPSGFVMSPFEGESLFLKGDLHYRFNADNQEVEDNFKEKSIEKSVFEKKFLTEDKSKKNTDSEAKIINNNTTNFNSENSIYNEMLFAEKVSNAIDAIDRGEVQKVVLSRTKNVTLSNTFDVIKAFNKLCNAYQNAFISLVYLPDYQCFWLGATPETLVSVDKDGLFRTMSLAGTQTAFGANDENLSAGEMLWSHKEIEEQAYVSRYIIECFKKIRLREYEESGPKTVQAGNLMHLRTDYIVDTKEVNFPQLGTVMLELLHPTSAVCGMPKVPALRIIAQHEIHDREFYSGFLGPVNIQEESHIFVNLRTMKIQGNEATFYAGCGITEDSNPVKEWYETEMKIDTLAKVIL
ncbi:MAG: chorismate-binding protein [Arcicella sp.]|nr:chorismate-binding protein [Arcicella sp.]